MNNLFGLFEPFYKIQSAVLINFNPIIIPMIFLQRPKLIREKAINCHLISFYSDV